MAPYVALITFVLGSLLIPTFLHFYKNRIGYKITAMYVSVDKDDPEITLTGLSVKTLNAERIKIKNYGYRNLEKVELHLSLPNKPFSVSVKQPSTISRSAINTEWIETALKISIPSFPSGEHFEIDMFRIGWTGGSVINLRGTDGKYKIVNLELHELKKRIRSDTVWFMIILIVASVIVPWIDYKVRSNFVSSHSERPLPPVEKSTKQ